MYYSIYFHLFLIHFLFSVEKNHFSKLLDTFVFWYQYMSKIWLLKKLFFYLYTEKKNEMKFPFCLN